MVKRYIKKVLKSTNHQEMQIKERMRYHLTPVKMASIKSQEITNASKDVGKRNSSTLLVGM